MRKQARREAFESRSDDRPAAAAGCCGGVSCRHWTHARDLFKSGNSMMIRAAGGGGLRPKRIARRKNVDSKTILRHYRVARITLSSEIIFNLWSIVLGDSVDHNVQSVWINVRSTLFECNLSLVM
jgi:hypothetical protein